MKLDTILTSSLSVGEEYIDITKQVAERLVNKAIGIVYGGTDYDTMSEIAYVYKNAGGNDLTGAMAKYFLHE